MSSTFHPQLITKLAYNLLICVLIIMTIKGGTSQACASCKYQRRRCSKDCALAPYFPADEPKKFQNAHRLFGVRNIMNILKQVHPSKKEETMTSIIFESYMRDRDPVYGCCGYIVKLQYDIEVMRQQIHQIKIRTAMLKDQSLHNQMNQMNITAMGNEIVANNDDDIVYPSYAQVPHQQYNTGFLVNQGTDGNDLLFGNVSNNGAVFVDNDHDSNVSMLKELRIQQHYHDSYGIDINNIDYMLLQSNLMPAAQSYPSQHEMEISHGYDEIAYDAAADDRQSYIESKETCDSSAESSLKEVSEPSAYSMTDLKNAAACFSLKSQEIGPK